MPLLNTNQFSSYSFTSPEEETAAQVLSPLNICNIQNLLAERMVLRINLTYDSQNPQEFLQQEAHLKGQIEILTFLLEAHSAALEDQKHPNQSGN